MGTLSPLFTLVRSFFLVFLPEEQKCSQNTIRSYRKSLELLFDFVKERNSVALNEITFEMMDRNTVSEFLSYLEIERNCSISTRNHRLHCIRAFFKYAAQEDITVIAHLEEIQKVKRAKQPGNHSGAHERRCRSSHFETARYLYRKREKRCVSSPFPIQNRSACSGTC